MSRGGGALSPFRRLWVQWKSLDLPWRRKRLVGIDLLGTTYWELRGPHASLRSTTTGGNGGGANDGTGKSRPRRIAQHPRDRLYADVSGLMSPAWHQWLRHVRDEAPTLEEQRADVERQVQLGRLVRIAEERWRSLPSVTDGQAQGRRGRERGELSQGQGAPGTLSEAESGVIAGSDGETNVSVDGRENSKAGSPKAKAKTKANSNQGNPGDKWQPEAWSPGGRK